MGKTDFIKMIKRCNGELYLNTATYDVSTKLWKDSNSVNDVGNGIGIANVIGVINNTYYVICPYCGEIEAHGSIDNTPRLSDCKTVEARPYYIKLNK